MTMTPTAIGCFPFLFPLLEQINGRLLRALSQHKKKVASAVLYAHVINQRVRFLALGCPSIKPGNAGHIHAVIPRETTRGHYTRANPEYPIPGYIQTTLPPGIPRLPYALVFQGTYPGIIRLPYSRVYPGYIPEYIQTTLHPVYTVYTQVYSSTLHPGKNGYTLGYG